MKIIDLAICINNFDPKGIGRIRCVRYNDYVSEKENSVKYSEWSDTDPFVAAPFLPNNLNFIPEVGQAVKILNFNTDKETVNQEYIAGPFTTMYDFNAQTFTQQIENTTYGVAVKHKPDIRKTTGEYIDKKSENTFAKEGDWALYGKYGSDILFTENGIQLRGGKLQSKETLSPKNKQKLISYPLMAKKNSTLYLKKFPQKAVLKQEPKSETIVDVANLKYVIEYEVTNLTGPTDIKFFIYRINNPYGDIFKTNTFNEHTLLTASSVKLVNTDNSTTTPTYTISNIEIDDVDTVIRDTIYLLHEENLQKLNSTYTDEDLHPFYYRPTSTFTNLTPVNSTEKDNKTQILRSIRLTQSSQAFGVVWSISSISVPSRVVTSIQSVFTVENDSPEQTFSALKSDKIYLLSTDTNETNKTIDFEKLNKYELSQEDYIYKIEPNTYSTVRGENLIKILQAIVKVIFTHRHNINKSIQSQPDYIDGQELQKLIETLENDILNKSIKIN